jgi:hypothetical protein
MPVFGQGNKRPTMSVKLPNVEPNNEHIIGSMEPPKQIEHIEVNEKKEKPKKKFYQKS